MNPFCSEKPCPVILPSKCVYYEGEDLPYTGINTNDRLLVILEKLDNVLASSGGGISDAPADGLVYGRQNGNWTVIEEELQDLQSVLNTGNSATNKGFTLFGDSFTNQTNIDWRGIDCITSSLSTFYTSGEIQIVNPLTEDQLVLNFPVLKTGEEQRTLPISVNGSYADTFGNIIVPTGGGGIPEAPEDDKIYGRKNADWTEITQYTNEQAQDAVGNILIDSDTIDLTYNDAANTISADVKLNSINSTHLADNINVSEFVNDSEVTGVTATDALNSLNTGKENTSNKAVDFTTVNNTLYPTTQAVSNYAVQKVINTKSTTPIVGGALNARMCVSNGMLYVTEYNNNKVGVFSLENPMSPTKIYDFTTGANPRHVLVSGRNLFVACFGSSTVEVWDIQNPESFLKIGEIPVGFQPKMFELIGSYLFVACGGANTVEKYKITMPDNTLSTFSYYKVGEVAVGLSPLALSYNNDGLLAVCGNGDNIIKILSTDDLNVASSASFGGAGHGTCAWFNKTQLLVTDWTTESLLSIDYSNLSTPVLSSSITVSENPEQIEIIGNKAYIPSLRIAVSPSYLDFIDLSDAKNPVKIKSETLTVNAAGFTAPYTDGVNTYLYVDGHEAPFNIDAIRVENGDFHRVNLMEDNKYINHLGVANLSTTTVDEAKKYTNISNPHTVSITDNVLRLTGGTTTLPNPNSVRDGKIITLSNASNAGNVTVSNPFLGAPSFTLYPYESITLQAAKSGASYAWDAIGGRRNLPSIYDIGGSVGIGTVTPSSYLNYRFLSLNGLDGSVFQLRKNDVVFAEIGGDGDFINYDTFGGAYAKFSISGVEKLKIDASNITPSAPILNAELTGTPLAPTAPAGTNTTQIATTAFVLANAGETVPSGTERQVLGYDSSGNPEAVTLGWKQLSDLPTPPTFSNGVYVGTAFQPDGSALFAFIELDTDNDATGTSIPIYTSGGTLPVQDPIEDLDAVNKRWFEANRQGLQEVLNINPRADLPFVIANVIDEIAYNAYSIGYGSIVEEDPSVTLFFKDGVFTGGLNFRFPFDKTEDIYTLATTDDIPEAVDTAFYTEAYSATMSVVYNPEEPNFNINLTGNLDLTITGTSNGDTGLVNLYFSGTEVATLNGTKSLVITGNGEMIPVYFIHDSNGLKWYYGDKQGGNIDTSEFAEKQGTILYHKAIATNVGTISNVGNVVTGVDTELTDEMIGAKIVKSNGEVGYIDTITDSTNFTTLDPFTTDETGQAFAIYAVQYRINDDGMLEMFQKTGERRFRIEENGSIIANGITLGSNGTANIDGGIFTSGSFSTGFGKVKASLNIYADHAAAIADTDLEDTALYKITGNPGIFSKQV